MAPEICEGKPHSFSADVWSLGQLAYQLLSVQGKKLRYLVPGQEAHWTPRVRTDLRNLITAMVSQNPDERPLMKKVLKHPFFTVVSPGKTSI